jgi:putative ATP-binding cassette transporter
MVFFRHIRSILEGFKEIKINRKKCDALNAHIGLISDEVKLGRQSATQYFVFDIMYAQTYLLALVGGIIFLLPIFSTVSTAQFGAYVFAVMFLRNPLSVVTSAFPVVVRGNQALSNIYLLEQEIDSASKTNQPEITTAPQFESLELDNISFHYPQKNQNPIFGVSSISFKINRGEILFIVGGNGSGKSTLLKLLTGLYYPLAGNILLNNTPLEEEDYYDYRELYSVIFTDFHLFDRLYGIDDIDYHRVDKLISKMGLNKKTTFKNDGFSTFDLSTGQKKRLAYIAAELDDKQIYIFDEWAADQDPEFRQYFYDVLLQDLKAKGKTVIAVSHDDRYFYAADKVIKLEYGQIVEYSA